MEGVKRRSSCGFVSVMKVPTQVICYSNKWLHHENNTKPLVIVLPGNPGSIEFYDEFMYEIYRNHKGKLNVWGISHAGHVNSPAPLEVPDAEANPDVYLCDGQIQHKLTFIEQHVPKGTPLILIGHSIGCYMVLKMLKRNPNLNVTKAILLFPAIEHLMNGTKAPLISALITVLKPVTVATITTLRYLPQYILGFIVRLYLLVIMSCTTPRRDALRASLNYFKPECLRAVFAFTRDIIENVKERDSDTMLQHQEKLILYYGTNDHWCPIEYYKDVRKMLPDADVRLCSRGFRHAFVLDKGAEMGCMVSDWLAPVLRR
ncbi:lipid droplet-associated hydrolase-like isoform X2 [Ornithodoros turicata]